MLRRLFLSAFFVLLASTLPGCSLFGSGAIEVTYEVAGVGARGPVRVTYTTSGGDEVVEDAQLPFVREVTIRSPRVNQVLTVSATSDFDGEGRLGVKVSAVRYGQLTEAVDERPTPDQSGGTVSVQATVVVR